MTRRLSTLISNDAQAALAAATTPSSANPFATAGDTSAAIAPVSAIAGSALQPEHLSIYRPQDYTPGGALLSDSNIALAIQAAYDACLAAGGKARIVIPTKPGGGPWHMGTTPLVFVGGQYNAGIWIEGQCELSWNTGFTGECIRLKGTGPGGGASQTWGRGGIKDLVISCLTVDASNTCKGLVLDGCVSASFHNIKIANMLGGSGLYVRDYQGDANSQGCVFHGMNVSGCRINYDLQNLTDSSFFYCASSAAALHDYAIDHCQVVSFVGGNAQSTCPINWDFTGEGGSFVSISDYYTEGSDPTGTLFHLPTPSITGNAVTIDRYTLQSPAAIFVDQSVYATCVVRDCYGLSNATTIVKARALDTGAGTIGHYINIGSPDKTPGKFDLDAGSLKQCVFETEGTVQVGNHLHATSLRTSGFVEGSEPASPVAGTQVFNTSTNRPRVHDGISWHDAAFTDDAQTLGQLLAPYCEDIWSLAVFSKATVISGELDSITGALNGCVLSAPDSTHRPVFTAADPFFGGRPSFTTTSSSGKYLSGTLHTPLPIGSNPGFFIVGRATGTIPASANRVFVALDDFGSGHYIYMAGLDVSNPTSFYLFNALDGVGGFQLPVSGVNDAYAHVFVSLHDHAGDTVALQIDDTVGAGANMTGLAGGPQSNLILSGGLTTAPCDFSYAFVAVLKTAPPPSIIRSAISLAKTTYGIGL